MALAPTGSGCEGVDIKPNDPPSQALPKQSEVIVISDDEDDELPVRTHNPPPPPTPITGNQDDNDDNDGIELVSAAGPMSAVILAKESQLVSNAGRRFVEMLAGSSGLKRKGKERAEEGGAKRIKSYPGAIGGGAGHGESTFVKSELRETTQLTSGRSPVAPPHTAAVGRDVQAASPRAPPAVWRPPTPPTSTTPPADLFEPNLSTQPPPSTIPSGNRFELDLASRHRPRAPGACVIEDENLWTEPSFSLDTLPFSEREIPSFERGSWLSLCSHRYVVGPQNYPRTREAQRECAVAIKAQLLKLFGETEWASGEEPKVSFPVVQHVEQDLVDIKFFTAQHHEAARDPPPQPLRLGYDPLRRFVHGAFVDPRHWLVLQFSHPTITLEPLQPADPANSTELVEFGRTALLAIATALRTQATPKSLWSLPEGYPHNPDLAVADNLTNSPLYILLLKIHSATLHLPSHIHISDPKRSAWQGWLKLWWNDRPVDLCNYCKSATDGHLNSMCTKAARKDRGKPQKVRQTPTAY